MNGYFINNYRKVHFIGIGGAGMYPLSQIVHKMGCEVSGSDNNETETLAAVRKLGIKVFLGQRAENVVGAELIVYSAAIMEDNVELIAARSSGAVVMERSELLGLITKEFERAVCVTGTHGKTTVTSMITHVLVSAGVDITAVIGGKLPIIKGSGISGSSDIMVCEACEFCDHYLNLYPKIGVILNVDEDHLDYFKNLDNIIKSFAKFCDKTTDALFFNGDDVNSLAVLEKIQKDGKVITTFGRENTNDFYPCNIRYNKMSTTYDLMKKGEFVCEITINVVGDHNITNSVCAVATLLYLGLSPLEISNGISSFTGSGRRFDKYGEVSGITVVDDYGHHPKEIEVTLKSALKLGYNRVWAVHQPFTFSRTAILLDDFAKALSIADKVVLSAIMGGREYNTYDIYTKDLAEKIDGAVYFPDEEEHDANFMLCADYVAENAQSGDIIITLGCGDVNKLARLILKKLEEKYGMEG